MLRSVTLLAVGLLVSCRSSAALDQNDQDLTSIEKNLSAKNPSPKPYSECDKPSDEFLYLVQQWAPGFCTTEHCKSDVPQKFTIHGLWPNYCKAHQSHDWPEFCTRQRFDKGVISDLLPDMEDNWESLTNHGDDWFWEHEWTKHGTCAVSYPQFHVGSQHEYFKKALDLASQSRLEEVLADHDIQPGGDYSVKQIQDALTEGLGGQAFLNCERDNVLVEIYLCYNQELEYVPCSRQGDCNSSKRVQYVTIDKSNLSKT